MFQYEDIDSTELATINYRHLQAEAKKLGLPCNVKKVHLIELIRAKRYYSENDLKVIVDRIKMERKIKSLAKKKLKKKRLQGTEISSTSHSPPLSLVSRPAKCSDFIQYNPDMSQTVLDYQSRPNILRTGTSILHPLKRRSESDRVLRSFNSFSRPNYRVMEQSNYDIDVVKSKKTLQETIQEIRRQRIQKLEELHEERSQRLMAIQHLKRERQIAPMFKNSNVEGPKSSLLRSCSHRDTAASELAPRVGHRKTDGKITKINAVVQKLHSHAFAKKQITHLKLSTLQDVINYKIENPSTTASKTLAGIEHPNQIGHQTDQKRIEKLNQNAGSNILRAINYSEADHSIHNNNQISDIRDGAENQDKNTAARVIVQRESQVFEYQNAQSSRDIAIDRTLVLRSVLNMQVSCNMEYQSEKSHRPWEVYDINGQLLNRSEIEHNHTISTHKSKDDTPVSILKSKDTPVSTHKTGDITVFTRKSKDIVPVSNIKANEAIATDYQSEYHKFKQQLERNRLIVRKRKAAKPNGSKILISSQQNPRNDIQTDQSFSNQECNLRPICYQHDVTPNNLSSQSALYPNMQFLTEHDYSRAHSVYYNNTSADPVGLNVLPKINDAFNQFKDSQSSLTQPLFVEVSKESDRVPMPPTRVNTIGSTCMLETIYNFKNQFVMNPPVLAIATTQTQCTYCYHTITTPLEMAAAEHNAHPYQAPVANPYPTCDNTLVGGGMKLDEPPLSHAECDEVLNSWSTTSIDLSQSSKDDDNTAIPDMMGDAIELISQDGDYMERIGMDVRVKCIICEWAGPKSILEYHIKQSHAPDIQHLITPEWSVLLTLGSLLPRRSWESQLAQFRDDVYIVSARYSSADAILIALSIIPNDMDSEIEFIRRGKITVYNKISGKPYTFEGEIYHLPDGMPDEYDLDCLSVNIGDLDLMPNSANLRLVNTELVGTPDKVVFGQPQLNEVEIIVYIQLLD